MAKHSYEFKKQLVLEYLDNQGSYASISQKHGMLDSCQLRKWVAAYKKMGDAGLNALLPERILSEESFLWSLLNKEPQCQELALQMGINNPLMLARWVNGI